MDVQVGRLSFVGTCGFPLGQLTASAFDVRAYAGGQAHLPSTYVGGTLGFAAATGQGATYRPLKDNAGSAVALPAGSSRAIQLPDAVFVGSFAKLTRAVTGAAVTVGLVLKG